MQSSVLASATILLPALLVACAAPTTTDSGTVLGASTEASRAEIHPFMHTGSQHTVRPGDDADYDGAASAFTSYAATNSAGIGALNRVVVDQQTGLVWTPFAGSSFHDNTMETCAALEMTISEDGLATRGDRHAPRPGRPIHFRMPSLSELMSLAQYGEGSYQHDGANGPTDDNGALLLGDGGWDQGAFAVERCGETCYLEVKLATGTVARDYDGYNNTRWRPLICVSGQSPFAAGADGLAPPPPSILDPDSTYYDTRTNLQWGHADGYTRTFGESIDQCEHQYGGCDASAGCRESSGKIFCDLSDIEGLTPVEDLCRRDRHACECSRDEFGTIRCLFEAERPHMNGENPARVQNPPANCSVAPDGRWSCIPDCADWRMPNVKELASLIDYRTAAPAAAPSGMNLGGWVWTSTIDYTFNYMSGPQAYGGHRYWMLDMNTGAFTRNGDYTEGNEPVATSVCVRRGDSD